MTRLILRLSVPLVVLSAIAGCRAPFSVLEPGSEASEILANLGWFVLILGMLVAFGVMALILLALRGRKGSLDEHAPYNEGGGTRWIVVGGFAAPAVILGAVFIATIMTLDRFPLPHADAMPVLGMEAPAIRVVGHQWWWEVKYRAGTRGWVSSANEIHVPAGRTVVVGLETADVIHSFWVPSLHGKVDLIPGQMNLIRIRADEPGVYRGRCAEFCGVQHTHMEMLVVAHAPDEYSAWLRKEFSPAQVPRGAEAADGRRLFETNACALCHTIRGVVNGGTVAPDLTHLASRRSIAAGTLPNTRGHLSAWIVNAPSLKPGVRMPAMTQFSGDELNALVTYLESLE